MSLSPFDPNGNAAVLVDQLIGTAYPVVKLVAENIEFIKHVSFYMPNLYRIWESIDGLENIITSITNLDIIATNIAMLNSINSNIVSFTSIYNNLNLLLTLNSNTAVLLEARDRTEAAAVNAQTAKTAAEAAATSVNIKNIIDRAALKALDTAVTTLVFLRESNREGLFKWVTGDFTTLIANDIKEGIYIKANAISVASGAWVRQEALPEISITKFGALLSSSQSSTLRKEIIQAAINFTAGLMTLIIPAGVWIIDNTLRIPSNSNIKGVGKDITFLKMDTTALSDLPVILTGDVGNPRTNISISDLTIDYNKARWGNDETGQGTALTGFHRGLAIINSTFVYIRNIKVMDPWGYGIDITSPAPTNAGPLIWNPEGCKYVWVEDCEVYGAGDDNFTTRHSSFVWFTRCYSHDTDRNSDGLSNGFEIDDGSRNIFLTDCLIERCEVGVQIKGHGLGTGAPAAYNIQVRGIETINCCQGFMLRNAAFSTAVAENTFDDYVDTTVEFSKTAVGILIDGFIIIAPKRCKAAFTTLIGGIDLGNYTNITMTNITIDDGKEDIGNKEYLAVDVLETYVFSMSTLLRRVILNNIIINGFRTTDYGIRATSTVGGLDGRLELFINNLIVRDGPKFPVFITSTSKDIYIQGYSINGQHSIDGGCAITIGGTASTTRHANVSAGRISGYQSPQNINGFTTVVETSFIAVPLFIADADGALVIADITASISTQAARIKTIASGSRAGMAIKANADAERTAVAFDGFASLAGKITTINDVAGIRVLFYITPTIWISGGAGSPEGVVPGPPGCKWMDGTNGVEYNKKTGTGNTGWKLVTQAP